MGLHSREDDQRQERMRRRRRRIVGVLVGAAVVIGLGAVVVVALPGLLPSLAPASASRSGAGSSSGSTSTQDADAGAGKAATEEQTAAERADQQQKQQQEAAAAELAARKKAAADPASDVTQQLSSGVAVKAPQRFFTSEAATALDQAVKTFTGKGRKLAFAVTDINTGRTISYNADTPMYPASSIKSAYAAMVFETRHGNGGMGPTLEQCLVNSSNDAFHSLIDAYGLASYATWLKDHGAPAAGAKARGHYYPDISSNEFSALWREIYRYGTSQEAGAQEFTGYLARTTHSVMGGLMRGSYTVWSKPGWYPRDGSGLQATNDTGVVFSDCGPYVMVVMSDASVDFGSLFPVVDALNRAHGDINGGANASLMTAETKVS